MADLDAATLDTPEAQQQAASSLYRNRVASNRFAKPASEQAGEKAIQAISQSPAGANPWVRLILIINNLANRIMGSPPNSTQTISMAAQFVAIYTVAVMALQIIILLLAITLVAFFIVHPEEVFTVFNFQNLVGFFFDVLKFFGIKAATGGAGA